MNQSQPENRLRCTKCNSPFLDNHWRHYAPREDGVFHTACFEQYKFPSLLLKAVTAEQERVVGIVEGKKRERVCTNPACGKESHPCENTRKNKILTDITEAIRGKENGV